jgi:N-acetylneuraminic acid mutarotase
MAVVDGRLYAIGGRFRHQFTANVDVTEVYDPRTDGWSTGAPLPTTRSGVAAATIGGRIYVFGGEDPDGTFGENEAYDPATDSWVSLPPMPTARHGLGAAVVGQTIYVVAGGTSPGSSDSAANEAYRP